MAQWVNERADRWLNTVLTFLSGAGGGPQGFTPPRQYSTIKLHPNLTYDVFRRETSIALRCSAVWLALQITINKPNDQSGTVSKCTTLHNSDQIGGGNSKQRRKAI